MQRVLAEEAGVQRFRPFIPMPYPLNSSREPIMSTVPQMTAGRDGSARPLAVVRELPPATC